MKKTSLLLLLIVASTVVFSQKLDYKIRSFGLGLFGNFGAGFPLKIENLGESNHLKPAYPLVNDLPTSFKNYQGSEILKDRYSYTVGASVHYKHSFGSNFIITLLGGYSKTQTSHYIINLEPFNSSSHPYDAWHQWYNYDHYFGGIQLGVPIGKKKGKFWNLGCIASIANVTDPFFQKDVRAYPGIVQSGQRTWIDQNTNEGFTFLDKVNQDVILLSPSIKYLKQFGKYQAHALEIGLSYTFTLSDNLITTEYTRYENGVTAGESVIHYQSNYLALEASYTIPLFRSKRSMYSTASTGHSRRNKKTRKSSKRSPGKNRYEDPILKLIRPDIKSCFKTNDVSMVRYDEDHIKFNDETVVFDLYDKDRLNDGDEVTVCVDGEIVHKNVKLTDKGRQFTVKTGKKKKINIVIFGVDKGKQGNISLGLGLISGGSTDTKEKEAKEGMYYWFVLERE